MQVRRLLRVRKSTSNPLVLTKNSKDQMGRVVRFAFPPKRIVSLVPSQTELLFDLGLDDEIVGITKFCVHPKNKWQEKPKVGGTKKIHIDRIRELNPDLIIGNKEENEQEMIVGLEKEFPVWMSDINSLEDALGMIEEIGKIVNRIEQAVELKDKIVTAFQDLSKSKRSLGNKSAAYFIWRRPYMVAAKNTFINTMMQKAGFINVFADKTRYPEVTLEEVAKRNPDVIMLSSEPYPFSEQHFDEIRTICQQANVTLVDGEYFSWYGSRMLDAASYFSKLHASL